MSKTSRLSRTLLAAMAVCACSLAPAQAKHDFSKGDTLFVVPYAHLDTQWRWAYPQVIREYIANTLFDNFKLIEKYPHYVFNFSGSRRYEFMKEYYPDAYKQLTEYIKAGRWFPCGSSVDENDANVPSAESLIRQVLYGNHYFRREFGTASQEYMLPDCFGFPYALPTVLAHCGLQGFSTQKLTWGSAVGIPFKVGRWIGPDGSSVVAALDPGAYVGTVSEDLSQNTSWLARIENTGKESGAFVDYHYYGTGDRGGAPAAGSVDWIEKSIAGKGPIQVVSARSDEMFVNFTPEQLAKLPKYQGELLLTQHSAGSISSQAMMKRWNRKNELLADGAERASVAAMWLGGAAYPSQKIYNAWDLVLGSQMHDMLPGTSIPKAYDFCWNDELLAANQFGSVEDDAVGAVSKGLNTESMGQALVVYNPLSIGREDVVEATLKGHWGQNITVYGPDGKPVATQVTSRDDNEAQVIFLAKVPSTGFAVYDARDGGIVAKSNQLVAAATPDGSATLDNGRFRVTVDKNGNISSVFDKVHKVESLKAPAGLDFQYHNPSAYPAWNMDWNDAKLPPDGHVDGPAKIRIAEAGPVRVTIEVERESHGSKFVQDISLAAGDAGDRVEVRNKIDWQTKEHALKAAFPLTTANPMATYDLQVGATQRGNNNEKKYEVPQHQWFDLTKPDGSYGVAILNDSKFGSDKPSDDTVRLTLLYTPGVRSGFADQATQDFGRHDILYAIQPHAGDWRKGGVAWVAKRLNQPLRAFVVPSHAGKLGKSFSLLTTSTTNVEVSALKKAEDSDEVIVRLRELTGSTSPVTLKAANGIAAAREVDGQERPLGKATLRSGALVTDVRGYGLRAFALKLGAPKMRLEEPGSQAVTLSYDLDAVATAKDPKDGAYDPEGRTYPANMFPTGLTVDNVAFKLGPTSPGSKNAVTSKGQSISIPSGYGKVYLLVSSSDGDVNGSFRVGDQTKQATVQNWGGYVGQWDNRLWVGDLGPNFTNYGEMGGLVPAYVKPGEVAWYCTHRLNPTSGIEYYQFSYLFKIGFDVPKGANTITLPNDPRIHVFAVSVAKDDHEVALAAAPLSDTLADHVELGGPIITPASGNFDNVTTVTIETPLYWVKGGLRYTVDGSKPTASSPVYTGPFTVSDPTVVRAAEIAADGSSGPVAKAELNVHDTTAPRVMQVTSIKSLASAKVEFSEIVDKTTAENPGNYSFASGVGVTSARLATNGTTVELTLSPRPRTGPVPTADSPDTLTVSGVRDLSKSGNAMEATKVSVENIDAVFAMPTFEPKTSKMVRAENLPVKGTDPWTVSFLCRIDKQPEDRTIIAGFGRAVDGRTGTGRYICKFPGGISFWAANNDVFSHVALDLGKTQMLTATYDGTTLRLYKDGVKIAEGAVELSDDQSQVHVMPVDAWERQRKFDGEVSHLMIWNQALPDSAIKLLSEQLNP